MDVKHWKMHLIGIILSHFFVDKLGKFLLGKQPNFGGNLRQTISLGAVPTFWLNRNKIHVLVL